MKSITVLMSTYNGEKYLKEQIESLIRQKAVKLKIFVRDDGSQDSTVEILQRYAMDYPFFAYYKGENLGTIKSFFDLITHAQESDYYAFCDQDDVWDEDKLSVAINKLELLDSNVPNLYYSNLRIVDAHLNYYRLAHKNVHLRINKYAALIENPCTGCTAVFNKTAKELLAQNIPEYCTMHDTWIYMMCNILGNVIYDEKPHISYRQHENNVVGAYLKWDIKRSIKERLKRVMRRDYQPRYMNCKNFYKSYKDYLNEKDKKKLLVLLNYKKSLKNKLELIFDKEIKPDSNKDKIRFIMHIIWGTV